MTLPVTQVTDHAAQVLEDQLGQFLGSPRLRELPEIIADEVQRVEDLLFELFDELLLDNAEGVQLDNIYGKITGVKRIDSESDGDYRAIIRIAILANNSDGHPDTVSQIVGGATGEDAQYEQVGRAHFEIHYEDSDTLSAIHLRRLGELLDRAAPLGVSWRVLEGSDSATEGSRFDEFRFNTARFGRVAAKSEDH